LGGLVVIDFIDMMDSKHNAEVEKTFKKALSLDRSRIQLSHLSKFGILELSRQKKQSTIQEISYTTCPFCRGRGVRPSLEYTALNAYRKIESQAVKGLSSLIGLNLPYEVADYLLNQKRAEISRLESAYDMSIHISGKPDMAWDEWKIETTKREAPPAPEQANHARKPVEILEEKEAEEAEASEPEETKAAIEPKAAVEPRAAEEPKKNGAAPAESQEPAREPAKKKSHRRTRHRRKKPGEKPAEGAPATTPAAAETKSSPETPPREPVRIKPAPAASEPVSRINGNSLPPEPPKNQAMPENQGKGSGNREDPLHRLRRVFESLVD
ncbi:MAG: ribonuclease E/G, partial [Pseudomonadota bacterium]